MDPRHSKPADARDRAIKALELRLAGAEYRTIASVLGYRDESGVRKAVDRLLTRREYEGVAKLRAVEGRRLNSLQRAVWGRAMQGDPESVRAALAIMARRARLFGLDCRPCCAVEAISEKEFAVRAVALLEVRGRRAVRGGAYRTARGAGAA